MEGEAVWSLLYDGGKMESKELINYKWQEGIYNLNYMLNLVKNKNITEEDFFNITRLNFNGVIKLIKKNK